MSSDEEERARMLELDSFYRRELDAVERETEKLYELEEQCSKQVVKLERARAWLEKRRADCRKQGEKLRELCDTHEKQTSPPVCSFCDDSHVVKTVGRYEVYCTHCPVPCAVCQGASTLSTMFVSYCARTPCPCACHKQKGEP